MAYTLHFNPRLGKFVRNFDVLGKMDPYLRITIGKQVFKTDIANGGGRNPVWKTAFTYKLTAQQYSQLETVPIQVRAFDQDIGFDDFIGEYNCTLRDVRLRKGDITTLSLFNDKGDILGNVEIEFWAEPFVDKDKEVPAKKVLGTIILKPTGAKFEAGHEDDKQVYFVFSHDDIAYQSGASEGPGSHPTFSDIISFKQFEDTDVKVLCFEDDPKTNLLLGQGSIHASNLQKEVESHDLIVTLEEGNKIIGELFINVEFHEDLFECPVKVFPILEVPRGEYIAKKFKYHNPDKVKKNIKLKSFNRDLVFAKNDEIMILPNEYVVINLRIFAPIGEKVEKCRMDIILEDSHKIEETILFKIKAIEPLSD